MNDFIFIPDEKHFQDIRFKTIGASDIPIILGLSKFCSPYQLWRYKTGRDVNAVNSIAADYGHLHEPTILYKYIRDICGEKIALKFYIDYIKNKNSRAISYKPPTNYYPYTEFIHPQLDWAMAHLDCVDIIKDNNIEAKSGRGFASYKRDGMDGFDKNDPHGYPLKYYFQIQWQMLCSGIKTTTLRALIDTSDELTYEIDYNKKIAEKLIEVASRFMFHVVNDKEPMPSNKDDIMKIFPKTHNKTAYLFGTDSELAVKMIERKKFLKEKQKKIKSEIEDINDSLFVYVGGNKYLYSGDNQKLCSQVLYEKEGLVGLSEIKKDNRLYNYFKKNKLIKKYDVRYIS